MTSTRWAVRSGGRGTKWKRSSGSPHQRGPGNVSENPGQSSGLSVKGHLSSGPLSLFLREGTTGGHMAGVCGMSAELLERRHAVSCCSHWASLWLICSRAILSGPCPGSSGQPCFQPSGITPSVFCAPLCPSSYRSYYLVSMKHLPCSMLSLAFFFSFSFYASANPNYSFCLGFPLMCFFNPEKLPLIRQNQGWVSSLLGILS